MDKTFISRICSDRLDSWSQLLVKDHATPVLLLGIGHDHRSGTVSLCTLEGIPNQDIEKFLLLALEKLGQI